MHIMKTQAVSTIWLESCYISSNKFPACFFLTTFYVYEYAKSFICPLANQVVIMVSVCWTNGRRLGSRIWWYRCASESIWSPNLNMFLSFKKLCRNMNRRGKQRLKDCYYH